MNNKFLDKVCDQIVSETRVKDDLLHTPFFPHLKPLPLYLYSFPLPYIFILYPYPPPSFISHCKEVYGLNEDEIDYVWTKYKEGVTALMEDKELIHQEKG